MMILILECVVYELTMRTISNHVRRHCHHHHHYYYCFQVWGHECHELFRCEGKAFLLKAPEGERERERERERESDKNVWGCRRKLAGKFIIFFSSYFLFFFFFLLLPSTVPSTNATATRLSFLGWNDKSNGCTEHSIECRYRGIRLDDDGMVL